MELSLASGDVQGTQKLMNEADDKMADAIEGGIGAVGSGVSAFRG